MLQKNNKHLSATMSQLKANTSQNTLSVSALDDSICCEVCTHTMWSPYLCVPFRLLRLTQPVRGRLISHFSLANCGHTFCQGCITDWFNTTLEHHRLSTARGPPPYTCPSCRIPVRLPPVQNFSLKRIVRLAAESRGESSPPRPQPPPRLASSSRGRGGRGGPRRDIPGPFDPFFSRR
ncbi:hypothetical protein BC826DRAFT_508323 [Russula brevipes]|nr:hypothetical protein BC826DRAFT_508323 [Russula brevipes]